MSRTSKSERKHPHAKQSIFHGRSVCVSERRCQRVPLHGRRRGHSGSRGYRNCPESAAWHLVPGGKYYTTRNGSAILAWRMPKGPLTGWHAAASHSDSPTWRIKTLDGADHGFARAEVEATAHADVHLVRPALSVAGRLLVRTADGVESRLVHPERALACIPNLCIHFNREANTGLNSQPPGGPAGPSSGPRAAA